MSSEFKNGYEIRSERNPYNFGAIDRSRQEFENLLPDGIHSKDQFVWSIIDEENGKVGVLWVQVKDQKAFIYDFVIDEAMRGKGARPPQCRRSRRRNFVASPP